MNRFRCKICGTVFDAVPKVCACGNSNPALWDIVPADADAPYDRPFAGAASSFGTDGPVNSGNGQPAFMNGSAPYDRIPPGNAQPNGVNAPAADAPPYTAAKPAGKRPAAAIVLSVLLALMVAGAGVLGYFTYKAYAGTADSSADDGGERRGKRKDRGTAEETTAPDAGKQTDSVSFLPVDAPLPSAEAVFVKLPDFSGTYYDALTQDTYYNACLQFKKEEQNSADFPAGTVIAQTPDAGTLVNGGTQITLTVSKGAEEFELPDVSGKSFAQAKAELTPYGLNCVRNEIENPFGQPEGTVRDTLPAAGATVKTGDTVTLQVYGAFSDTPQPPDGPDDPNTAEPPDGPDDPDGPVPARPTSKNEILDFYKAAVNRVKYDGAAGYTKKEWQSIESADITGNGTVDATIKKLALNYMTTAEQAEGQVYAKGSQEAKDRFPNFTLTDYSKVKSATIQESSAAYKIVIVMQDEDTPHKGSSFIAQVTNSVLLWEDIDAELKNISVLSEYSDIHIWYRGFTITAVTGRDGRFTTLQHVAPNIDIRIGHAKVIINIDDKSARMTNYCMYTDFIY